MLHYKDVDIQRILQLVPGLNNIPPRILERVEIAAKYAQHILRQDHDVKLFLRDENLVIDPDVDYSQMRGMSTEVRQRLTDARPLTLVSLRRFLPSRLFAHSFHPLIIHRDTLNG
jgi:tRNA uridine 5-carboxymethylaminomethyl modification enzyme